MTERHLEEAALVAYVSGASCDREIAELERHVIGCAECAIRLQRCAWVETAMFEAASQMHPPRARVRGWGQRLQQLTRMPAGLALAASLVLGLGAPERWLALDVGGVASRIARADVDGGDSTPWGEAPACDVPEDSGGETCDDPTVGGEHGELNEGELLAMSWPEPSEPNDELSMGEPTNLCVVDADGSDLACSAGELLGG